MEAVRWLHYVGYITGKYDLSDANDMVHERM